MRLSSTSTRTFALVPLAVGAEMLCARRRPHAAWLPLLAWGYGQYKAVGRRRLREGGGPPGMSQGMPERLVTDGAYSYTRNPMYLGHLVFLTGLALLSRSPVAVGYLAWALPWFDERAAKDEARLRERFGADYEAYLRTVPRWLGRSMGTTR
jgi:protein-S-isoprenylcysteine O-methyltransferase Ste14